MSQQLFQRDRLPIVMNLRVGHGYDIHRTIAGRPLVLGGVRFECDFGLDGHSDADCLTHAICDALLGAAGLPDIGHFFPNTDPIGKTVTLDGRPFTVVGTSKAKGSVFGQSQDNFVFIPMHTYFRIYGSRGGIQYNFQAYTRDQLNQAQDEVRAQLRAIRHTKPGEDDTFAILSTETLVSAFDSLTATLAGVAIGVVSVFMVVGGVVIMNIMLAVVSERTREIGIRKSVGARQSDILNQFLVESCTLSATGGLIGVTIAWLVAVAVRNFTPVPMAVPPTAVAVGLVLSTIVGLFFGIYPARRAAKLDPIVALRAEN